jgi:hypothetical protein
MQAHVWQLCRCECGFELGLYILWFNRPAKLSRKEQSAKGVIPFAAGGQSLLRLPCAMTPEQRD